MVFGCPPRPEMVIEQRRGFLDVPLAAGQRGFDDGSAFGRRCASDPSHSAALAPPSLRGVVQPPHNVVLTAVLPELVRWLPATAAGSMRQTCQELLPALDATRASIADSIARTYQDHARCDRARSALLQAGMSSAEVMAVRAQAWRLLDQCNQHMLSSAECWQSIALALLRLSAKFILTSEHADIFLRILPPWPRLQSMECRLVIALWTDRNNQAPHYRLEPPQPLARPARSRRWRGQLRRKPGD